MIDNSVLDEKEEGGGIDFGRFFKKVGRNFHWVLLTMVLFGAGAYMYLRYAVPQYQVSTVILMSKEGENDPAAVLGQSGMLTGTATPSMGSEVNNEIYILQSASLMRQVVDSLDLDIQLATLGRVKNIPVNRDSADFSLHFKKPFEEYESPEYKLVLAENSYTLEHENKKINGFYGKPVAFGRDTIQIDLRPNARIAEREYLLKAIKFSSAVSKYMGRLAVTYVPKAGEGMLQVSLSDEIPQRANKIINVLIHKYNVGNQQFKNHSVKMALDFLNNRVSDVYNDLEAQENQVKDFKASNKIYDVSTSANQLLGSLSELDAQKGQNTLRENLLNLVETNLKSYNDKEEIVPNANGLQDPVLTDLIGKYNQLVLEKRLILDQGTTRDLRLPSINGQLEEIRSNISKNIGNIRNEINANARFLTNQESRFTSRFESLPAKEKQYVQINRAMGIKESLYVYLLQKREETEIQLVSKDVVKFRTIDEGLNQGIVSPNKQVIFGSAIAAGLLIPALVILVIFLSNKRIETRKQVEAGTSLTIAGEISYAKKLRDIVVTAEGNRTAIAEQFRALRTNLSYLTHGSNQKALLVTSTVGGEGKSFISLNLANSIATSNKKVVLIELDLRKPKLTEKLGLQTSVGMSEYLAGEAQPAEIIQSLSTYRNLYFIGSGAIPPNPAELILNNRLGELMTYLKHNFDYVVIDSPPVGLVSEAITIGKHVDATLFILRHKYSQKSSLKMVNELSAKKKLPNVSIVINGIHTAKNGGYGEDYGSEYGYVYSNGGDGYFETENGSKKRSFWKAKTFEN